MSIEVGGADGLLGMFATNKGYSELIAASQDNDVLKKFFFDANTEDVPSVVEALRDLTADEKIKEIANRLADMIDGQELAFITNGLIEDSESEVSKRSRRLDVQAPTLYSYIVKKDGGFAPNPFFGYCTLACCKPGIRRTAKAGDWIVGLTPKSDGNRIVYFMEVEESIPFDDYWRDPRFREKKPQLDAGTAQKLGDNIYQPKSGGGYRQLPSAHSKPQFENGEDAKKMRVDLEGKKVLISRNFAYFGSEPKELPPDLKALKVGRSYRCHFQNEVEVKAAFRQFVSKQRRLGVIARPRDWHNDDGSWKISACGGR